MPGRVEQQRAEDRRREIDEIGPKDSARLHDGMNKSGNSEEIREHKQPDMSTGRRDGNPDESTSDFGDETSGSKRHAAAGAGPSEPTPTTAEREGKRATSVPAGEDEERISKPTRRNDSDTTVETKSMHDGSKHRGKPQT